MEKIITFSKCLNNQSHHHEWDEYNLNIPQVDLRIESMVCDVCIEWFRINHPTAEEKEALLKRAKQLVLQAKNKKKK